MKYFIGLVLSALLAYNSVYFQSLDEKLAEEKEVVFDAQAFVDGIWDNELIAVYDSAKDLSLLLKRLHQDPELTFSKEAQSLGIGNIAYFKVKGEGVVLAVNENNVLLKVKDRRIELETEFIFGNAIRDASGLIKSNDYEKTADFNSISESLNDKIRKEVIPAFREKVSPGDKVHFQGALELNKAHLNLTDLEIIPLSVQLNP